MAQAHGSLCQLAPRGVKARVHGPDRNANQLRDVLAVMILDLEHDQHRAAFGFESVQQIIQSGLSLQLLHSLIGRFNLAVPMLGACSRDVRIDAVDSFATPEGSTTVSRHAAQTNSVQPRGELGVRIVGVQAPMCDHEHILKNVFEIGTPNTHALQGEPNEVLLAGIDADEIELAEGLGRRIDGASSRPLQR